MDKQEFSAEVKNLILQREIDIKEKQLSNLNNKIDDQRNKPISNIDETSDDKAINGGNAPLKKEEKDTKCKLRAKEYPPLPKENSYVVDSLSFIKTSQKNNRVFQWALLFFLFIGIIVFSYFSYNGHYTPQLNNTINPNFDNDVDVDNIFDTDNEYNVANNFTNNFNITLELNCGGLVNGSS